ncbi:MAG: hypothetical protein ABIG56_04270 [Candidatus Omnitrophota bacterium]
MIKAANLGKEIAAVASNKVGILADMSKLLAESNINIEAVAGYAQGNQAKIMLVCADNARATDALKEAGYKSIQESEVIVVELENKPGALKIITEKLVAENIDIKQIYGTTCSTNCPAKLIFTTSDNSKALAALKQ